MPNVGRFKIKGKTRKMRKTFTPLNGKIFSAHEGISFHTGGFMLDKKRSGVNMNRHGLCVHLIIGNNTRPGGNALTIGIEIAYGGVGGRKR